MINLISDPFMVILNLAKTKLTFLNLLQFKCCGVHGAADFKNYNSTPGASVPDSCCVLNKEETVVNKSECQKEAKNGVKTKTASLYGVGCLDEVKRLINQNMTLLIGVGAGVAGFELLVVIMAIGFCCSMKDDD